MWRHQCSRATICYVSWFGPIDDAARLYVFHRRLLIVFFLDMCVLQVEPDAIASQLLDEISQLAGNDGYTSVLAARSL